MHTVLYSITKPFVTYRGRHARIFGCAKSVASLRPTFYTSDLWPISHNIGIGDKQKSCVMCLILITINQFIFLQNSVPTAYLTEKHQYCFLRESFRQAKSCATALYVNDIEQEAVIVMNI